MKRQHNFSLHNAPWTVVHGANRRCSPLPKVTQDPPPPPPFFREPEQHKEADDDPEADDDSAEDAAGQQAVAAGQRPLQHQGRLARPHGRTN